MTIVTTSPGLEAALDYARCGWLTFPVHRAHDGRCSCGRAACDSPGKHPHTKNGLKDATVDEAAIRQWWKRWPNANVAVATGATSGLVVLDVDGELGKTALGELTAVHGALPATVRAATGGHGLHYLFAHPGEVIRNSAGSKLGPGLDIRGDGGYIVVPPSVHASGRRYEWEDFVTPLSPMPDWLLERLRDPAPTPRAELPAAPRHQAGGSPYGLEALAREITELGRAQEGGRNNALNTAAFSLGQLVAGGELEEALVRAELERTAVAIGLGEREIPGTIASGIEDGKSQPRVAPERPERSTSTPAPPRHLKVVEDGGGDDGDSGPPEPPGEEPTAPIDPLTDLRNARRLVARHRSDLRYCHDWGTWLAWDGHRWRRDETGEAQRRAKAVVGELFLQAAGLSGEQRKQMLRDALQCERQSRLEAMVRCAQTEAQVSVVSEDLDTDPWALNCLNGTVDLRTGELSEHRREDNCTKLAPVDYDLDAPAPIFDAFLDRIFAGNTELISFVQRAVGYALTGRVSEQVMFFLYGGGANGKSTLIDILQHVLGDYSKTTERDLLIARRGEVHPAGVADLVGVRLAVTIEAEAGRRFDEGLVKQLTGGDRIKARFMRENFFEFAPTHKLFFASNHKPMVRGTDLAIWRRMRLIPFDVTIPPAEQDRHLKEKLEAEAAGVLAWAVRGCLEWQRNGLGLPPEVASATEGYRAEMDVLGQFIEDALVVDPHQWLTASELRKLYVAWCNENGEYVQTQRAVGQLLSERGFIRARRGRSKVWVWEGLAERGPNAAPLFEVDPEPDPPPDAGPAPPEDPETEMRPHAAPSRPKSQVHPSYVRAGEASYQIKGREGAVGAAPEAGSDEPYEEEF